jgi:hypothetical protein
VTAALAAGGTLLAVMIAISAYGAVTLPATARVPLHWGGGWGTYVGKRAGLIVWPAAGALVYAAVGLGAPGWSNGNQASWQPGAFMIVIMGLLAAFQARAITVARRAAEARRAADGAAAPEPADPMAR